MAFNISNSEALASLSLYENLDADLLLVGHGEPWTEGPKAAASGGRRVADPVALTGAEAGPIVPTSTLVSLTNT